MTRDSILQEICTLKEKVPSHEAKHLHTNLLTLLTNGRSNKLSPVVQSVLQRKPKRILDIGCGYGALAIFFAMQGIEAVGIDLQTEALVAGSTLSMALGVSGISLKHMDACAISESGFDMALSTDFFEHITYEQQPEHLRSVWQALRPGGVYIIRAPHRSNIRQHREDHIGLPSFGSLYAQATNAGFSVRFGIAHTRYVSPYNYTIALEHYIESCKLSDTTKYKLLKKCGLANVVAHLKK